MSNTKEQGNEANVSNVMKHPDGSVHESVLVPSSPGSSSPSSFEESEDGGNQLSGDTPNQLVVYEPTKSPSRSARRFSSASKKLPFIGAFTVQCADCFQWRLMPSKEKYEEIRECILQRPFTCEMAREWRPDIRCNDPTDISQDGSRLWALDKPNIAQPPPGWQRLLHIRGEGCTRFADVYYVAPSGKRFRSMVEIQKYLAEHPEYVAEGIKLSQFSFQIPIPLREDYVRKRPARVSSGTKAPDATEAKPVTWIAPEDPTDLQLQLGRKSEPSGSGDPPSKKPRKSPLLNIDLNAENPEDHPEIDLEKTGESSDGS
ncbi:PREDICTED: methyl-CpG-binding domain-containing protein 2-like [Tarenaya hassleriana]|uniref:methyl-CpG-binding domain-containing protein 2-like n=1 Tax=Tarenaya hassleriana TaxID=28532 RepID=UPI00053C82A1|nr:PREDICTED: methyl-CpG-binding domain-containing protein 2-like [Tarenaya hassleriana]XP_010533053.1 PREDICTED: methyl-CpG-binding domain-containing protein 2-like [Tarenaya hassleriana]XP_010533054.1 PREDICTED: methyl-CpG-binding domain-containing protein 2-like [Tarenaya hassleriana]XP_010533055.1 PREDICTED: methyl-CpG-binding domain-containing protein 2-like [Tarenaya hassleriana]XP_010533057.1 PREDICTED: methyl-CpG-binding domain-containing protein 2-like [Tarenaya hassleriana]